MQTHLLAIACACAALPFHLLAQTPSGGPLAGAAVAVLVDGGLAAGTDGQTRVHRNGFGGSIAPLPPALTSPDLRTILAGTPNLANIDFDDISLGRDDVNLSSGMVDVGASTWAVWQFSLRQGAQGAPGSRIREETLTGNVGGALFSWILPPDPLVGGPLPPQVTGRVERSHSALELGLPQASMPDVDGLDVPVMLGRNQNALVGVEPGFGPLVGTPAIYFTVSHATRGLVPLSWWGNFPPSGANILETHVLPTGGGWSTPVVFRSFASLTLQQNDDIDALAYDEVRNKLLFSLVGTSMDQLLFADLSTDDAIPEPAKTSDGQPISQQVGKAQNDDIDAVCTLDPTLRTQGGPPPAGDDFGSSCGSYTQGLLGVPRVGASAFRRYDGVTVRFDSWMVGWPPLTGIGAGFAVPFVTLANDPTIYLNGPIQLRDVNSSFAGDPRQQTLAVPATMALSGFDVTFRWVAIDANATEIAEAWPVKVFL